ncbi:putative tetratricopeptide-like helical domain superfamily [Helianthus anomalus]
MEDENVQPNQVTLTCVLASCSHGGLVNKGLTLFKSMRECQWVEIRHEHYACVIDILCRSGKIEEAYGLVQALTLSNIYAGEGKWAKVAELREVMKLQGVQKQPGFSSVYNNI